MSCSADFTASSAAFLSAVFCETSFCALVTASWAVACADCADLSSSAGVALAWAVATGAGSAAGTGAASVTAAGAASVVAATGASGCADAASSASAGSGDSESPAQIAAAASPLPAQFLNDRSSAMVRSPFPLRVAVFLQVRHSTP